ncbi:MAG: lysophospholipid acyltransferase family protein [Clostridium sp.]
MIYWIVKNSVNIYLKLKFKVVVKGYENIPEGGAILAANHLSNYDPFLLATTCKRKVRFMAKAELFKSFIEKFIFGGSGMIPVKRGAADIAAIKTSIKALKSGELIGIFVEGTRVKQDEDSQAKSGVAMLSVKSQKPVVPVNIKSSFKRFSTITITYGKPINLLEGIDKKLTSEDYKALSSMVLDRIRGLEKEEDNANINS